jgi:hypothetical protein
MEEKYKIHAFYILAILISIIIILMTIQWSGIPNLAEKISFALTLASLVLAALAIGYAVYSNTTFSQTILTLNTVAGDVSKTAGGISKAADSLNQAIENIPTRLESMESKVDRANILLQQFSERSETQPPTDREKRVAGELVESFIQRTSLTGLLILYAYNQAYSKGGQFNIEELALPLNNFDLKFARGFVGATRAAGLINSTSTEYDVTVTYVNERLKQYLETELEGRFMHVADNPNVDKRIAKQLSESLMNDKRLIDQYFSENT